MDDLPEREPFKPAFNVDKAPPPDGVELFEYVIKLLEATRSLIDVLKKYKEPLRTDITYTIVGMGRDRYFYPPVVDDYIDKKEYATINVSVIEEHGVNSTSIELIGTFGTVYLSRDSLGDEDWSIKNQDHIVGDDGKPVDIDSVPNSQINDFLYSITRQGIEDPTIARSKAPLGFAERVVGEDMHKALEAVAETKSVNRNFELDNNIIVWFSEDSSIYGDKQNTVSIYFKDRDKNERVIEINTEGGFDIRLRSPEYDNSRSGYLHTGEDDYAIALEVIQKAIEKILTSTKETPTTNPDAATTTTDENL
jgi:hypothetical protein